MYYRIISGMSVDNLLVGWSRYCQSHNIEFGASSNNSTNSYLITSEGKECNIYINQRPEHSNLQTLESYLYECMRRHPELSLDVVESEEEVKNRSFYDDDTVGLIFS